MPISENYKWMQIILTEKHQLKGWGCRRCRSRSSSGWRGCRWPAGRRGRGPGPENDAGRRRKTKRTKKPIELRENSEPEVGVNNHEQFKDCILFELPIFHLLV